MTLDVEEVLEAVVDGQMKEAQGLDYLKEFLHQQKMCASLLKGLSNKRSLLAKTIDHSVPYLALFVEAHI